jgi:hypothetical protein
MPDTTWKLMGWAWLCVAVIPAAQEVKVEKMSSRPAGGKLLRTCLKNKTQTKGLGVQLSVRELA